MKTLLSLRLGVAALLAAGGLSLPAQTVPALISQFTLAKPKETAEQKAERHARELVEAEGRAAGLAQSLPLLSGAGAEERLGKFLAELAKLRNLPEFQEARPVPAKAVPGKAPVARTIPQMQAERREADLALMRKQADRVLAKQPELRDFVEQQFQWHKGLFELGHRYWDNPRVQQLVHARLRIAPAKAAAGQ